MKVAIVYPYIAHYRLPIFSELSLTKGIEYTMIADIEAKLSIKTIDPKLGEIPIQEGGLRLRNVKNLWIYKGMVLWQRNLLSLLRKNDFSAVIFLGNTYYISTWAGLFYAKLNGKKVYLWTHGVTRNETGLKWKFRRFFYNLSDGLFLYGHKAKEIMIKNDFAESKLHVVYNSLDYTQQIKYRAKINSLNAIKKKQELFKNPELPVLVFVGRLTNQKKLDMIVEAVQILAVQDFKLNTLFIGEGQIVNDLNQLINKYTLEDYFHFYGACYEESQLAELIGVSDICVSPGEVGLTAITALTYGTPVISHDDFNFQMPEYEVIIPGVNGDLFKRGSINDLAEKIKNWLLKNKTASRDKIRAYCYQNIDTKYNPKNQAQIINEIITNEQ